MRESLEEDRETCTQETSNHRDDLALEQYLTYESKELRMNIYEFLNDR